MKCSPLNSTFLNFRQNYGQVTQKYNKLKEKFAAVAEQHKRKMEGTRHSEKDTDADIQTSARQGQPINSGADIEPAFKQPPVSKDNRTELTSCQPSSHHNSGLKELAAVNNSIELPSKPQLKKSSFKPSYESAFTKPSKTSVEQTLSTEIKPAGPIPSQQATKPACGAARLPRRVEQTQSGLKQPFRGQTAARSSTATAGAMQPSNQASRTAKDCPTFDKTKKAIFCKENKENNVDKPDACTTQ